MPSKEKKKINIDDILNKIQMEAQKLDELKIEDFEKSST